MMETASCSPWRLSPYRPDAPASFAILAARSLDMLLSVSASYCLSFLTLARVPASFFSFRAAIRSLLGAYQRLRRAKIHSTAAITMTQRIGWTTRPNIATMATMTMAMSMSISTDGIYPRRRRGNREDCGAGSGFAADAARPRLLGRRAPASWSAGAARRRAEDEARRSRSTAGNAGHRFPAKSQPSFARDGDDLVDLWRC